MSSPRVYHRICDFAVTVVDDTKDRVSSVGHENKTYNEVFSFIVSETVGAPDQHSKDHKWVRLRADDKGRAKALYNALLSRAGKRGMKLTRSSRDGYMDLRLSWRATK